MTKGESEVVNVVNINANRLIQGSADGPQILTAPQNPRRQKCDGNHELCLASPNKLHSQGRPGARDAFTPAYGNFTEQYRSGEAHRPCREIHRVLWKPTFCTPIHNSLDTGNCSPDESSTLPRALFPYDVLQYHLLSCGYVSWCSLPSKFSQQYALRITCIIHDCCVSRTPHLPLYKKYIGLCTVL